MSRHTKAEFKIWIEENVLRRWNRFDKTHMTFFLANTKLATRVVAKAICQARATVSVAGCIKRCNHGVTLATAYSSAYPASQCPSDLLRYIMKWVQVFQSELSILVPPP